MTPKFPEIQVQLVGNDGNSYSIMARVSSAMRRNGCSEEDVKEYLRDSKSGDRDHLLRVAMETVDVL